MKSILARRSFLALAGCCLLGGVACAQTADIPLPDVPPPKLPIVAMPAERSTWSIQITPVGGAKGPLGESEDPRRPLKYLKQQEWSKTGPLLRCITTWTDGSTTQDWIYKSVKFYQSPQGDGLHLFDPKLDPRYHNFNANPFERLDWLSLQNYAGAVKHAGQSCYLFRTKGLLPVTGANANSHNRTLQELTEPTRPSSAYISVDTHLPVTLVNDDGTFEYRFGPEPTEALVMPEPYLSMWRACYSKH